SLQTREREVEPGDARDRKVVGLRIAALREHVELASAGIAEAEQAGALVERLARGVVERRAEQGVAAVLPDVEQHRVAAAREQAEERRLDGIGPQVERGNMAVQVVDRHERQPPRPRDRLSYGEADEQRS